jgi:hypothetical protein
MILTSTFLGISAAKHGSARTSAIAVVLAVLLGSLILYGDAHHVKSDDSDEQNNENIRRSMIFWWWVSLGIAVGSAGWVAVKRLLSHKISSQDSDTPEDPGDEQTSA